MHKFVIKEVKSGVVFHLVANNGETIGTSQPYASKEGCKKGIDSVKTNAGVHVEDQTKKEYETLTFPKFEIYLDKGGEHFRFRLMAHNGQEILASQAYTSKEGCKKGIDSVNANAKEAPIEEEA